MKKLFLFCCLAAVTVACSDQKTVEKEEDITVTVNGDTITETTRTTTSGHDTAANTRRKTGKVVMVISEDHIFSDPTKPDNFQLAVNGTSLLTSHIRFTISNPQGKVIYEDSLSAADLEASMVYTTGSQAPTPEQREAFVKKRLNEFFDQKHFSPPAVSPNDAYQTAYRDQTAWEALKKDRNAVGFNYLVGKENGRRIAYSKLRKKVMLVGNFGG